MSHFYLLFLLSLLLFGSLLSTHYNVLKGVISLALLSSVAFLGFSVLRETPEKAVAPVIEESTNRIAKVAKVATEEVQRLIFKENKQPEKARFAWVGRVGSQVGERLWSLGKNVSLFLIDFFSVLFQKTTLIVSKLLSFLFDFVTDLIAKFVDKFEEKVVAVITYVIFVGGIIGVLFFGLKKLISISF